MCFGFGCLGWWGGAGFGWMWFGALFWLAFLIFIIWLIVQGVRSFQSKTGDKDEDSLKILKRRYAKGELTKKQYLKMKKDIEEE